MNVFVLDLDHRLNAQWHVDRHVVKMPLELAQILCTVHHANGTLDVPYRATHRRHPCVQWAGASRDNYSWALALGIELCTEYTFRYGKVHGCQRVLSWCADNQPAQEACAMTPFFLAMPDEYKATCPVLSYRNYYIGAKSHLFRWTRRDVPGWLHNGG